MDPTIAERDEAQDPDGTAEDAVETGADVETTPVEPSTPPKSTGDAADIDSADAASAKVDATVSPKETTADAAGTEGKGARGSEGAQDGDEDAGT